MSFTFTPASDEDLELGDLAKEGVYHFKVIKSERKVSKSGNQMAALQLLINDGSAQRVIFDWLVFSDVNMCKKKVSHFCKTVGLVEEYKQGQLREELEGYEGKVDVGICDEMPNPNGGFYARKNVVLDYVPDDGEPKKPVDAQSDSKDFVDNDIPF